MRAPHLVLGLGLLLACGTVLAACGGSGSAPRVNPDAEAGKSRPAPSPSAFPAPRGRTAKELINDVVKGQPAVKVSPAAEAFYPGPNRYPFLVSERDTATGRAGKEIADAEVAIYYAKVPTVRRGARSRPGNKGMAAKARGEALEQPVVGPFPARIESLATRPPFQGRTTTESPDVASVVYSAELTFPSPGEYRPIALIKEKDGFAEKSLRSVHVGEFKRIPRPGEKAPLIQTPTAAGVGGDLARLSTRVPADTQNKVNYAEVLGKEPILLLFTSPKFCQSRVCGPVVDVAQQAQHEFEGKANFFHMEIYNHNDPSDRVRPQVRRFHLPSEPWLFAIDREGIIRAAVEGGFGTELMDETVEKVIAE